MLNSSTHILNKSINPCAVLSLCCYTNYIQAPFKRSSPMWEVGGGGGGKCFRETTDSPEMLNLRYRAPPVRRYLS